MRQFVSERRIPSNYTENASKQDRRGVASFSFRRPIKLRQRRASETTDLRAWRRAACWKSFARFYQEFSPYHPYVTSLMQLFSFVRYIRSCIVRSLVIWRLTRPRTFRFLHPLSWFLLIQRYLTFHRRNTRFESCHEHCPRWISDFFRQLLLFEVQFVRSRETRVFSSKLTFAGILSVSLCCLQM